MLGLLHDQLANLTLYSLVVSAASFCLVSVLIRWIINGSPVVAKASSESDMVGGGQLLIR